METHFSKNLFGTAFFEGRGREIKEALHNNMHCAVSFEPGAGEADFVKSLRGEIAGGLLRVMQVDLAAITGHEHLAKSISRAAVASFSGDIKKIDSAIKKLIPTASMKMVIGESAEPYMDFEYGAGPLKLLENILNVPEMLARDENRRTVFIWPGAGAVAKTLGPKGTQLFIGKVSGHTSTSHLITGSRIEPLAKKLGRQMKNRLLFEYGENLLGHDEIVGHIRREFESAGAAVTEKLPEDVCRLTGDRMELVNRLCRRTLETAGEGGAVLTGEHLASALDALICDAGVAYTALWNLLNARQKSLLFGLSSGGRQALYSGEFLKKYGFGTATNLQAALRGLENKSILVKKDKGWIFSDPFFREWIRRLNGMSYSFEQ